MPGKNPFQSNIGQLFTPGFWQNVFNRNPAPQEPPLPSSAYFPGTRTERPTTGPAANIPLKESMGRSAGAQNRAAMHPPPAAPSTYDTTGQIISAAPAGRLEAGRWPTGVTGKGSAADATIGWSPAAGSDTPYALPLNSPAGQLLNRLNMYVGETGGYHPLDYWVTSRYDPEEVKAFITSAYDQALTHTGGDVNLATELVFDRLTQDPGFLLAVSDYQAAHPDPARMNAQANAGLVTYDDLDAIINNIVNTLGGSQAAEASTTEPAPSFGGFIDPALLNSGQWGA